MDENKNTENQGEIYGFDEVQPSAHDSLEQNFTEEATPEPQFNQYNYYQNPAPKKVKEKKRYSLGTVILSVLLSAIIGAASGVGAIFAVNYLSDETPLIQKEPVAIGDGSNVNINVENVDATVVEAVAEKVTPSVVGIRTTVSVTNFFGGTEEASGEGSGVIYTDDGYIITNYHVISDAVENSRSNIHVFLSSNSEQGFSATVVGYNISCDLAVIKINASNLPKITFSGSDNLKAGQFVVAIGNPGGLEFMGSVTYGVISGLNRIVSDGSGSSGVELIQTDAAINPGNSGGALVNVKGELVGINSSKIVSESYEGMGFAIPSDTVKEICDKIIDKEYEPTPYLGVVINEKYDPETLEYYGYPVGAVINSVALGSPADEAGLERGDIITEFNGVEITHYSVLSDALSECKPGQTVEVTIYRGGREYTGNVKIGSNNS